MATETFAPKPQPYPVIAILGVALVLGIAVPARGESWMPIAVAGAGALTICGVLFALLFSRNTRVMLAPGWISHTDAMGRTRQIPAASVAAVVVVESYAVRASRVTTVSDRQLFLLNAEGAGLLRLRGSLWSPDALAAVRTSARPAPEITHDAMTPESMRAQYPLAIGVVEAHPYLAGLIGTVAVVGIALVIAVTILNT